MPAVWVSTPVVVIGVVVGQASFAYLAGSLVVLVTISAYKTVIGWFDRADFYEELSNICRLLSMRSLVSQFSWRHRPSAVVF